MPPKPRPVRKVSSTTPKDAPGAHAPPKDTTNPSTSMPPPPDPVPPLGILEGEATALSACLQSAVVKTGQIYCFYADVQRLGIQQFSPRPPRSLTMSLRREIIKYDQFCDAMESHLLRAITVLQRDLGHEEARIKAEEEAAAAAIPKPSSPTAPAGTTPPGSPSQSTQPEILPDGTIRVRRTSVGVTPVRRQSTISLTSLSRPAFPPKLDLSASALRINPEEMMIPSSGFSSPVTLAPRSARAPSVPPDLMMAALGAGAGDPASRPVDIDLTVDDDVDMAGPSVQAVVNAALGSSADKPIELDLDLDEFFPRNSASGDADMFGPHPMSTGPNSLPDLIKPKEEHIDLNMFSDAFPSPPLPGGSDGGLFASLGGAMESVAGPSSQPQSLDASKAPVTSPLLAGFAAAAQGAASGTMDSGSNGFDIDMAALGGEYFDDALHGTGVDMMSGMDDILNMYPSSSSNTGTGGGAS